MDNVIYIYRNFDCQMCPEWRAKILPMRVLHEDDAGLSIIMTSQSRIILYLFIYFLEGGVKESLWIKGRRWKSCMVAMVNSC